MSPTPEDYAQLAETTKKLKEMYAPKNLRATADETAAGLRQRLKETKSYPIWGFGEEDRFAIQGVKNDPNIFHFIWGIANEARYAIPIWWRTASTRERAFHRALRYLVEVLAAERSAEETHGLLTDWLWRHAESVSSGDLSETLSCVLHTENELLQHEKQFISLRRSGVVLLTWYATPPRQPRHDKWLMSDKRIPDRVSNPRRERDDIVERIEEKLGADHRLAREIFVKEGPGTWQLGVNIQVHDQA